MGVNYRVFWKSETRRKSRVLMKIKGGCVWKKFSAFSWMCWRLATPKNAGKALIAVSQQKYLEKQLLWPREEKADSFQSKALQTGITVRQLSGRVGVKGLSTPVITASWKENRSHVSMEQILNKWYFHQIHIYMVPSIAWIPALLRGRWLILGLVLEPFW